MDKGKGKLLYLYKLHLIYSVVGSRKINRKGEEDRD